MNDTLMTDFPKLHCPFIRQTFKVDRDRWQAVRGPLKLRAPEVYLVVDRINPGYEWVFEDEDTFAVEKLDGTNVKILTENGRLTAVQNRKNPIDPLQLTGGKSFIIEGVFQAAEKGYVLPDGEQAGEVVGPKLQGNPYKLDRHLWYPFDKTVKSLRYRSFHDHERTFDNWSSWFRDYLVSRFFQKTHRADSDEKVMAEGVVFYNLKRKAEGKTWMAKLRRDMFDWYYSELIAIEGYDRRGRDDIEDQDRFD